MLLFFVNRFSQTSTPQFVVELLNICGEGYVVTSSEKED